MNILVTGATGFIGNRLVKRLVERGHSVKCLIRKSSNVAELKKLNVLLCEADLLVKNSLGDFLDGVDILYHVAGEVYSRRSMAFRQGNTLATANLLEACIGKKIKKFVFVSSIAVYKPTRSREPLKEDSACAPITTYGRSKLEAEKLVIKFFIEKSIPAVIVRGPVIYGPGEPEVLSNFFRNSLKKKITIIGDGQNLRSLCYVDNFVDGLLLAGENEDTTGKTYNISDKNIYTFNTIIGTISEIIGEKIRVMHLPRIIGDMSWFCYTALENILGLTFLELYSVKTMTMNLGCDISKAERELGYVSSISLREGLKNTLDWISR